MTYLYLKVEKKVCSTAYCRLGGHSCTDKMGECVAFYGVQGQNGKEILTYSF